MDYTPRGLAQDTQRDHQRRIPLYQNLTGDTTMEAKIEYQGEGGWVVYNIPHRGYFPVATKVSDERLAEIIKLPNAGSLEHESKYYRDLDQAVEAGKRAWGN